MRKIILLIFLISVNIFGQKADSRNPNDEHSGKDYDSITYHNGVKNFKKGNFKKAKRDFRYVFVGVYTRWNDSTVSFLKKNSKMNWISYLSERVQRGYNYADSLFYETGKNLFLKEEFDASKRHLRDISLHDLRYSVYEDSAKLLTDIINVKLDSLKRIERQIKDDMERKWVYLGIYEQFNKYGEYKGDDMTYFDENNLLFEGDSACVVIKSGDSYFGDYRYVSLNLSTRIVHGIDASFIRNGKSYNYIWDGDWWNNNSGFGDDLYNAVVKYKD